MTAIEIASLIEEHWSGLQREMGGDWADFLRAYKKIVKPLEQKPDREKIELVATEALELVCRHDQVRELLKPYLKERGRAGSRTAKSGLKTLEDEEAIEVTTTRFLSLPKRDLSEHEPEKREEVKDVKEK